MHVLFFSTLTDRQTNRVCFCKDIHRGKMRFVQAKMSSNSSKKIMDSFVTKVLRKDKHLDQFNIIRKATTK